MKRRTLTTLTALTAAAGLTLAGCGDSDDGSTAGPGVTASGGEETAEDPTNDETATDEDATATDETTGGSAGATGSSEVPVEVSTAVRTAEQEAGGTAYELDDEDDDSSWEIDVAVGDRSVEVTVGADGTEVLEVEEDDLDDDDREALSRATITITDAIATALAEVPGTLDDVELDDEGDSFVWEVTVDTEDQDDIEVYVDVVSGDVVRVDG